MVRDGVLDSVKSPDWAKDSNGERGVSGDVMRRDNEMP